MNKIDSKNIITFRSIDQEVEFQVILDDNENTIWVTQLQIMELFDKSKRTIGEHIKNIYTEKELDLNSIRRELRQVQKEGNRKVNRRTSCSTSLLNN